MKNTRIIPMRRLPGPAGRPLCEGVKTPEAPVGLFRGWQRTQTQSSVRTLRSLRQQMDVWFCLDRKSTRLNSSHLGISYAVFCLKKKKNKIINTNHMRETGRVTSAQLITLMV